MCFSQRRKAEERGEKLHGFRTHEADGFHNFRTHHHHVTYIFLRPLHWHLFCFINRNRNCE
ncbi:SSXT family protein [Prunus dulcis]|uniref:SSXT family protein n=1 Tax=Prunus dulcis TaxID=3755 RepID=A0A4Y1R035_PRUDU|nr:hypothetical protein Prudu_006597 [Prunus dulcis]BBG97459.1 SSXT family protein [Prunus dulcis]